MCGKVFPSMRRSGKCWNIVTFNFAWESLQMRERVEKGKRIKFKLSSRPLLPLPLNGVGKVPFPFPLLCQRRQLALCTSPASSRITRRDDEQAGYPRAAAATTATGRRVDSSSSACSISGSCCTRYRGFAAARAAAGPSTSILSFSSWPG